MKNKGLIAIFLSLFFGYTQAIAQVTREEVLLIAQKYNLQDSIAEGYKSPWFTMPPEEAYGHISRDYFEQLFQRWKHYADVQRELKIFEEKKEMVKSKADYYALMESLPTMHADRVAARGGIENYERIKKEQLSKKYHVYLSNTDRSLVFILASEDDGTFPGKRLD